LSYAYADRESKTFNWQLKAEFIKKILQ